MTLTEQGQQRKVFAELLMKCQALDQNRNRKFRADIHQFVVQAIADSAYLVEGKYPPDIIEAVKARSAKK